MTSTFANKTLISSLTQDIKKTKSVCDEICSKLENCEFKSWLCPLKTNMQVLDVKDTEKAYLVSLELLTDRLYLFLNSIYAYIDKFTQKKPGEKSSHLVSKPSHFSLGVTVNLVWERIQSIQETLENVEKLSKSSPNLQKCSKETQTEENNLSVCDSCFALKKCIKNISTTILSSVKYSFLEKARDDLQVKMYDITQVGFVTELCEAIAKDIKKIVSDNNYLECCNQRYVDENNNLTEENDSNKFKIETLEYDINQLKENLTKEQYNIEELTLQVDELTTTNQNHENLLEERKKLNQDYENTIKECKDNINNLEKDNEALKERLNQLNKNLFELTNSNKILENNIVNYKEQIKNLQSEKLTSKDHLNTLKVEIANNKENLSNYDNIKKENEGFKNDIQNLSKTLCNMAMDIDSFKNKYKNLEKVNKKYEFKFENVKNCVNNTINSLKSMDNNNFLNTFSLEKNIKFFEDIIITFQAILGHKIEKTKLKNDLKKLEDSQATENCKSKIKGDPLIDMKLQMDANVKNINQLNEQNKLLLKTIERLQNIQNGILGH